MTALPAKARVVIISGGISGCSVAYRLAALGWTDIVLSQRNRLTSGTTCHAAGLVGKLRAGQTLTRLARYSAELYGRMKAETGLATGVRACGPITVALTADRREEILRQASLARAFGVAVDELSPAEIAARYPHLNLESVKAGVHLPGGGHGDQANITLALAKGTRMRCALIVEDVKVTGVTQTNGRVTGLLWQTGDGQGQVAAERVVNAAGMWRRELAASSGVALPLHACKHVYIVTEPIVGLLCLPVLRVPDKCASYTQNATTFASELAVTADTATVTREVDGGLQTITVKMPAIVTVDLRLNDPRYASLPNIMKAKAKPMALKTPADYGVDVAPRLAIVKTVEPAGRKAGVKVASVTELIAKLKDEAGVI